WIEPGISDRGRKHVEARARGWRLALVLVRGGAGILAGVRVVVVIEEIRPHGSPRRKQKPGWKVIRPQRHDLKRNFRRPPRQSILVAGAFVVGTPAIAVADLVAQRGFVVEADGSENFVSDDIDFAAIPAPAQIAAQGAAIPEDRMPACDDHFLLGF